MFFVYHGLIEHELEEISCFRYELILGRSEEFLKQFILFDPLAELCLGETVCCAITTLLNEYFHDRFKSLQLCLDELRVE